MPGPGGSADIADFVFTTSFQEGNDPGDDTSTMTVHNHDMRIETTRDETGIDSDIEINSADDVWITGNDEVEISAVNDSVRIFTNDFENKWEFKNNGELDFPDGTTQTTAYTGEAVFDDIKTRIWGYPSENAVAIMPNTDNEAISLKSSDSAAIRWHVRNNGQSSSDAGKLNPTSAEVVAGDGNYLVTFTFPEENSVPTTTQNYYSVVAPNSTNYEGAFLPSAATTTTLTLIYESDPGVFDPTDSYINQPSVYSQVEANEDGVWIKNADWSNGPASYSNYWQFTKDGSIHFPYGPSNQRTGFGDVLRFATSFDQSIITGAPPTFSNPTANRLVVAGQDGTAGDGYDGEGGDVYLWAGRGGGTNGDGGDIKIDGGNGQGTGVGGYVKVRGGYSQDSEGGFIEIDAGSSYNGPGGSVTINAGNNSIDMEQYGGSVSINAGSSGNAMGGGSIVLSTFQDGKITLNGDGGEYLNSVEPGNQIAKVSQLPTGATGSFTSADGKTITVTNGIITGIS